MKLPRIIPVEQVDFSASALKTREIPRVVHRGLYLHLTVTHTNGASPAITADTFFNVVQSLDIVINGQDTLIKIPLRHLYYKNYLDFSIAPYTSLDTTASTQVTSQGILFLPFALMRSISPNDTLLPSNRNELRTTVLHVNWGSSIGTGVTSLDSGNIKIYDDLFENVLADEQFGRHEMATITQLLNATGSVDIKIPTGGQNQLRRLYLYTRTAATDVLSDTHIDNVKLFSQTLTYYDSSALVTQNGPNRFGYALAPFAGLHVIDLTRGGKMSQRLDASNLPELILRVNALNTTGKAEVVIEKTIFQNAPAA